MRILIIISITLCLFSACRNKVTKTITVENKLYGDSTNQNSFGTNAIFQLTDLKVYSYLGKSFQVKIPDSLKERQLYWTSTYYGVKTISDRHIFVLLLDTNFQQIRFIADKNANLDFTDDKVEYAKKPNQFEFSIYKNKIEVLKKRILVFSDSITKSFISSANTNDMLPKHNSELIRSVYELRQDNKLVKLDDTTTITLYDYGNNGKFNDKDDRIYNYNIFDTTVKTNRKYITYKSGEKLRFANKTVDIKNIWTYGEKISFETTIEKNDLNNYVANASLFTTAGKKLELNEILNKTGNTILYFGGSWCKGCVLQADSLPGFVACNTTNFKFVYINTGDKIDKLQQLESSNLLGYPIYVIANKNLEKLKVSGFPTFLLIDDKRIIKAGFSHYTQVEKYFKERKTQ